MQTWAHRSTFNPFSSVFGNTASLRIQVPVVVNANPEHARHPSGGRVMAPCVPGSSVERLFAHRCRRYSDSMLRPLMYISAHVSENESTSFQARVTFDPQGLCTNEESDASWGIHYISVPGARVLSGD